MRWLDEVGLPTLRAYFPALSWFSPGRPFLLAAGLTLALLGLFYGGRAAWQRRRLAGWQTVLPQTSLVSLAESPVGVWVAGAEQLWRCAPTLACTELELPQPRGAITSLAVTAEGLWLGTEGGLWRRTEARWYATPITGPVTALAVDDQGCLWVLGGVIRRHCAGSWREFSVPPVQPLALTAGARVWVGGMEGIAWWDEVTQSWRGLTGGGACLRGVRSLALDAAGRLWVGTGGDGVCCYDGAWRAYTPANSGLPHRVIHTIAPEPGGVWLATESPVDASGAVAYFDGRQWTTWTPRNTGLAGGRVQAILDDGSRLWFATREGLSVRQKPR